MRRLQAGILLLALAATAGALYLVYTADNEENKVFVATANLVLIWAFIGTGLIAWTRRPENRFGLLMTAVGLSWIFGALNESSNAYVYAAGSILGGLGIAVFIHALLAFPRGYLESRLVYAAVGTAYGLVLVGQLTYNLFDKNACTDNSCPRNVLFVHDSGLARTAVGAVAVLGAAFIIVATIHVLLRRWRAASPPLRRQLAPVFTTSATTLLLIGLAIGASFLSSRAADILWYLVIFSFASVPLAFLAGLLRTRLAGTAVARLVLDLQAARDPKGLCAALRRALGDPSLDLAYWLPEQRAWIDTVGAEIDLEAEAAGRATALVEHEGEVVAALIHDPTLAQQPDLVHAVAAAASLTLARERSIQTLRQSESRYRALLEAIPDLMFRMSRDGTYLDFKGDRADLASPPEELIGANARDILPPDVADRLIRGIERALEGGEVQTAEYTLTINGVERAFEARIVRDGDEAVLIVRDITERKRHEEELRRSRVRLVQTGDDARRRLERNLHDGAQQRLVSLSLALRLAHARLNDDPDEAKRLLEGASAELAQALEELRELARGIHPAVLSERGLAAALETLAGRAPLPVDVSVPEERFPTQVEAAAYYVVSEALTNVAKYAEASGVEISVKRQNGRALVEVADDGVGGADPTRGSGLRGLVDRVEALDGVLEVESRAGAGTRIRAEIPCA